MMDVPIENKHTLNAVERLRDAGCHSDVVDQAKAPAVYLLGTSYLFPLSLFYMA